MKLFTKLLMVMVSTAMLVMPMLAQNDPPPGFPIIEDFSDMSGWTLQDDAIHDCANGWLQLTNTASWQEGLAVYNTSFPSASGCVFEFDFYAGGGTGADGIAFFLVDGTTDPVIPGFAGAGLGYCCNVPYNIAGIPNAYIGRGSYRFDCRQRKPGRPPLILGGR